MFFLKCKSYLPAYKGKTFSQFQKKKLQMFNYTGLNYPAAIAARNRSIPMEKILLFAR